MTEAMPFLQKYDITFLRPPTIKPGPFLSDRAAAPGFWAIILSYKKPPPSPSILTRGSF